jgi:hypothetical protein
MRLPSLSVAIALVVGCGSVGLMLFVSCGNNGPQNNVPIDMAQSNAPVDMAQGAAVDMSMAPAFTVTGNGASTYSPAATITTGFTCINDPSAGRYVKVTLPDNFAASSPVHGVTPLNLNIYTDGVQVTGGGMGVIYYSLTGVTLSTAGNSGTVPSSTLNGQSGAMGTLTVAGGWTCP